MWLAKERSYVAYFQVCVGLRATLLYVWMYLCCQAATNLGWCGIRIDFIPLLLACMFRLRLSFGMQKTELYLDLKDIEQCKNKGSNDF